MRGMPLIVAASALCLASAAQARMPVFIEYEGVKGETTKAPAQTPSPARNREGGVNVATKDIDGDGRGQALLLPAVQKVREAAATKSAATSSQGPYQINRTTAGQSAPAKPKPKPTGSLPTDSISLNYPKPKF